MPRSRMVPPPTAFFITLSTSNKDSSDIERLNLNSLYNALDLRFGRKYSKEYAHLQMKTRLQKTGESLQEYAFEIQRLTTLANVREMISLKYFVGGLKDEEIQRAIRMTDVHDLKSALKLDAANEASCRDSHSVRGARMTADVPCESLWIKEIEKQRGNSRFNGSTSQPEET
ncbi:UNVERIFIED_CONTAM: hypothetical protein NCL1_29414 [Trichonephila clavipes]